MHLRLECRILRRHLRPDLLAPLRKLLCEFLDSSRLFRREIVLLLRICGEIEELPFSILELLHKLPVSVAKRARGASALIGVMRKVPVERPGWHTLATQHFRDAHAIER